MKIILENEDINEAIRTHVETSGVSLTNTEVDIIISTRSGESTATITLRKHEKEAIMHMDLTKPEKDDSLGKTPEPETEEVVEVQHDLFPGSQ